MSGEVYKLRSCASIDEPFLGVDLLVQSVLTRKIFTVLKVFKDLLDLLFRDE